MARPKIKSSQTEFQSSWLNRNLESLEKDYWEKSNDSSYLIETCHELRKKLLKNFETEDLRVMIGQDIGLKYLVPIALKTLNDNILAEGDYYPGDLLKSVLTSDKEFWKIESKLQNQVCDLYRKNQKEIERELGKEMNTAFDQFEKGE
jgi:hypothetical protein